ncbi:MAG: hypothetical protein ABSA46_09200 [Thermodesulfovibrionales bacterium]|jgi:hypothetical protein
MPGAAKIDTDLKEITAMVNDRRWLRLRERRKKLGRGSLSLNKCPCFEMVSIVPDGASVSPKALLREVIIPELKGSGKGWQF